MKILSLMIKIYRPGTLWDTHPKGVTSATALYGRQQKTDQYWGPCHPCGGPRWNLEFLAVAWASLGCCRHWKTGPRDGRYNLSVTWPFE